MFIGTILLYEHALTYRYIILNSSNVSSLLSRYNSSVRVMEHFYPEIVHILISTGNMILCFQSWQLTFLNYYTWGYMCYI